MNLIAPMLISKQQKKNQYFREASTIKNKICKNMFGLGLMYYYVQGDPLVTLGLAKLLRASIPFNCFVNKLKMSSNI